MEKVIVIGCPGSGKSTFSRSLHNVTGIPLYHLDMMNWNADRTIVPKMIFRERLHQAIEKESWIIDGNYGSTIDIRLQYCDTVFFLDYPLDVCLKGVLSRKGKERTDMPWIEEPGEEDSEFIEFIKNYNLVCKPDVMDLLNKCEEKDIFIFKSRDEADQYLSQL
ncbi:MAG: adenylate kinase [Turicibacter sp.]